MLKFVNSLDAVPVEDHCCYEQREDGFHLAPEIAEELDRYDREMAAKEAVLAAKDAQLLALLARREMRETLEEAGIEQRWWNAVPSAPPAAAPMRPGTTRR